MACTPRIWLSIAVAGLWTALLVPPSLAVERLDELRQQALQCEKQGDWARACTFYSYILSKDRSLTDVKERFQTCLRHFHRVRRHQDASYRQQVLNQDVSVGLKVYGEVLTQLRTEYLEEERADLGRLFQQGIDELRLALHDQAFRREYLPDVKKEACDAFLSRIGEIVGTKVIRYPLDAQNQALRVALAAKKALGLKPTVTVLEFACGACNALDEHTYYLTPRQFSEDHAALRGETVGVGVELSQVDQKLIVAGVLMNSPAAKAGIITGDRVVRIDRDLASKLSINAASEKLRGKAGTVVELEVVTAQDKVRSFSLVRQAVSVSVAQFRTLDAQAGVGYLQVSSFHENTLQELDVAIRELEMQGMKALVLDLRGNPGGLFDAAVQIAERFLWEGAFIVSTRGRVRDVIKTSRNLNPLEIPLVVLIDGGTASASEVLAGALKENQRATLVGQTTFGKGTIQHMVELKTVQSGGLRITWAKFYSPLNHAYSGSGVTPHLLIERSSLMFDDQLETALEEARLLLRQLVMMPR